MPDRELRDPRRSRGAIAGRRSTSSASARSLAIVGRTPSKSSGPRTSTRMKPHLQRPGRRLDAFDAAELAAADNPDCQRTPTRDAVGPPALSSSSRLRASSAAERDSPVRCRPGVRGWRRGRSDGIGRLRHHDGDRAGRRPWRRGSRRTSGVTMTSTLRRPARRPAREAARLFPRQIATR